MWTHLFKATVELVRQLHTRDTRRRFCPGNTQLKVLFSDRIHIFIHNIDGHWTSERVALTVEKVPSVFFQPSAVRRYRLFQGLTRLARTQLGSFSVPYG